MSQDERATGLKLEDLKALVKEGKMNEALTGLGNVLENIEKDFRPNDLAHSLKVFGGTVSLLKRDTDVCQARYRNAFGSWAVEQRSDLFEVVQFELRQLIRTFFAEVDGTLYSGRLVLLWAHERKEIELSIPEIALLREEGYRFDRKAKKAVSRASYSSTLDTLLLTLCLLPRLFKLEPSVNLSKEGWASFQKLLEVRNSITHPKDIKSLVIETSVVLKSLPSARFWYYEELVKAVPDSILISAIQGKK